ncbi:putative bifunctional diguanylate cyclase/phosphodiesterase [Elioraea rosea]|uniref:putative bifunctional diguanylate cyclase/phosphodiesterase n=1 Tax=Elioraea rosea TaxID=2492390 RepID=UPI001183B9F0|nr:GGDEF and EAL domain-containing protein [Elioraea rosea]
MPPAPLPPNESERIAAVHALRLLDTQAEERFDRFVRLARSLADMPIALFTMVDSDRQWFKAREGLDATETPRDHAFCAHAILDPENPLLVEDAREDERFADNPLVTGPLGIRFYAGAPVRTPAGHAVGTLCVIDTKPRRIDSGFPTTRLVDLAQGVSEMLTLHAAVRHLRGLMTHDAVTGLLNRRGFEDALAALSPGAPPASLLLLDLDGFKAINDMLGYTMGDAVLAAVGARLSGALRRSGSLARLGGDTFAVLTAPAARAAPLARRMLAALDEPLMVEGHRLRVGASIGIARFPLDGAGPADLLRAADAAVYAAKTNGKRIATTASPSRRAPMLGRRAIAGLLRDALSVSGREPFSLAWQPIVDARTGEPACHEALIRWPRPDGPAIMPAAFIPVAEKSGMISRVDRWVLNRAASAAVAARLPTRIAVNLSPPNLLLADLEETVTAALARSGLPPNQLVLEITEQVMMRDRDSARATVEALRKLGVMIALDDFGEGASSFNYLRDLQFDTVKIDRRLVQAAASCRRSATLLGGMIGLVRELGAMSIAEGVETEAQAALLRRLGVDAMQGWLFGRPGPLPVLRRVRDAA